MGRSAVESALRAGAGAEGVKLIETLHWDGAGFGRLALHLARLERSAALLGWTCDLGAVQAALRATVPVGPARVRLTLDAAGAVDVQALPLPPPVAQWRLGLAGVRLQAADVWLSVKSTRRAVYDAARAGLSAALDEVIFQNERGEVCDGTITTLFFDRGAGLRTPPLTSGLLPGVLRADLLLQGCREEVLLAQDLGKVRLWLGNALRGLAPAVWRG